MGSNSESRKIAVFAAPGKVLVAGGYLVLDENYCGVVQAVDSYVYSAVSSMKADINSIKGDDNSFKISVNSVQFNEAEWVYTSRVIKPNNSTQNLALDFEFDGEDENKNKFVEATLKNTLRIALIKNQQAIQKLIDENQNLRVNIGTDNDFYTQRSKLEELGLEITTESLKKLPKMGHTNTTLEKVNKTGLGSSAAMVTSLVGAVLAYFGVIGVKNRELSEEDKQLVHNISQLSHCSAQGKIGSGFDVSAAVYGTHIYRRFSPSVIEQAMELSAEQAEKLLEVVDPKNKKFNSVVQKINLPPGTILRLADIQAGSNTPSMVSKVLKWRKDHEKEAQQLWNSIDEYNQSVVEVWHELNKLCLQDRDGYYSALSKCSLLAARCWNKDICANGSATDDSVEMNTVVALGKLYATSLAIRRLMREMGERCGVPIEPQSQTQLLDRCLDSPGVCMAGVPGAGGYDAIYCICISETCAKILESDVWLDSSQQGSECVTPLLCSQSDSGCYIVSPSDVPPALLRSL